LNEFAGASDFNISVGTMNAKIKALSSCPSLSKSWRFNGMGCR
jgi:hypothetical protein